MNFEFNFIRFVKRLYQRCVIHSPKMISVIILICVAIVSFYIPRFQFDASAETLLLKNDPSLEYYRSIKARYGSDDFLVIAYTPDEQIFSDKVIGDLTKLKQEILNIKNVQDVISIIDVPLIKSPPVTVRDLKETIYNIENNNVDMKLAKKELLSNPIYKDLLISKDAKTTAILISLISNKDYKELIAQRDHIREQRLTRELGELELKTIRKLNAKIDTDKQTLIRQQKLDIQQVRDAMSHFEHTGKFFLGGVPMIAADSIDYIRHDVYVFGMVVLFFVVIILSVIFREFRWVILPLVICLLVGVTVIGTFGLIGWPVTVVSSNFLPLLLIITLSLTVHLTVKYREIEQRKPFLSQEDKVFRAVKKKLSPCFYTAATTIAAFGSLMVSGIQPLIDFGLMMSIGVSISFIFSFTLFPALLVLNKQQPHDITINKLSEKIIVFFANLIQKYAKSTILLFVIVGGLAIVGVCYLSVENRFIDYYKKSTDIYKGMVVIDSELGGTTPLDIIIDAPQSFYEPIMEQTFVSSSFNEQEVSEGSQEGADDPGEGEDSLEEDDDIWDLELSGSAGIAYDSYWFNTQQLKQVDRIHDYLTSLPQTGKVLSLSSSMSMVNTLTQESGIDDTFLSLLYVGISKELKNVLFKPYLSEDGNQLRFSARIFESDSHLKRQPLLDKIKHDLTESFNLEPSQIHLSGMLVLYNNMLQSFFKSQILTLGVVFLCILFMFFVTFKNWKVACIAIVPNIFAGLFVLGLMGLLNIPLDLMTICIAAICVGVSVDDTIHYIHRFEVEWFKSGDYWGAVKKSHTSIGLAMYFTTLIITIGFAVLVFSNFVPTIYFGLLTGCSMMVALLADLTLLPLMLVLFKPYLPSQIRPPKKRRPASSFS